MKNAKLLMLVFSLLIAVALLASCGGDVPPIETDPQVTEAPETDVPETNAPETEAPETEAPETEAPETEAPETEAPETEAPVTEPDTFKSVTFDFENASGSVTEYIESFEGFKVNSSLNGGTIENGRWNYSSKPLAISDTYGIYNLDKFSIEFDFCFDAYVNTTNDASIFTIVTDDDGKLNEKSGFYMAFRMNSLGQVFHGSAKNMTFQVELGKEHHYKIEIDNVEGKAHVYFDGALLCSPNYAKKDADYVCFRFVDNNKGAVAWIDNIVIKNLAE